MSVEVKEAMAAAVASREDALVALSHRIHAHPELAFEEERASAWCAEALDAAGFEVEGGVCDFPTAFTARAGSGPLHVAICAEYDALPGIGHACGHNVIAAAAVGAGAALAPFADELGLTVTVIGTPAEESGGGKILLLERGAFDGVHAAMMVHPAPDELEGIPCLAVAACDVTYTGRAAHAALAPYNGRNAADAQTVAQVSIGLLRQHLRSGELVHGIVTHGGDVPNVIPASTSSRWYVRTETLDDLAGLEARVHDCFRAGSTATGCSVDITRLWPPYSEFHHDPDLVRAFRANADALGRFVDPEVARHATEMRGSTDMANVSRVIPSIHPMLGLGCAPVANHEPEFAELAAAPVADRALVDGAVAMAWTCVDMAGDAALSARLRGEVEEQQP